MRLYIGIFFLLFVAVFLVAGLPGVAQGYPPPPPPPYPVQTATPVAPPPTSLPTLTPSPTATSTPPPLADEPTAVELKFFGVSD